jgi:hypothetical protein
MPATAGQAAGTGLAVLGIDPGSRWTAGVLRYGPAALWGWTVGPRDERGVRYRYALDDPDDVAAVGRYLARIGEMIDATLDRAAEVHGLTRCRLAVETILVPVGYTRGGRRSAISIVDWLVPREVVVGLVAMYPDARLVRPDGHGRAAPDSYPVELRRRRPPGWPPNETPRGERDHERAAYDIAGVAAGLP